MILTKKKFQKLLKIDKQSRKKYVKKKNNKKKYNSRRKKKQNDYCKSLKQKGGLMGMCNMQQTGGLFGTSKKSNDDNLIAYKTSIKDLSEMITKIKIYLELLQDKITDDKESNEILSQILTSTENVAKGVIESYITNIDNTYFSGDNSIEKLVIQYDEIIKKNETLSAKQRAVSLELAKLANMQQKTSEAIEGFNGISNES